MKGRALAATAAAAAAAFTLAGEVSAGDSKAFSDPAGDANGGLDVVALTVANDDAGRISFSYRLADGQSVAVGDYVRIILVDADDESQQYVISVEADADGELVDVGKLENDSLNWSVPTATLEFDDSGVSIARSELGNATALAIAVITGHWGEDGSSVSWDATRVWTYTVKEQKAVYQRGDATFAPKAPRAGKRFAVKSVRLQASDGSRIPTVSYSCRGFLDGRRLRPAGKCAWKLPRTAKGKILTVQIDARYAGGAAPLNAYRLTVR